MSEPDLTSVVIPVHDRAALLPEAVASVLDQAGCRVEVVIVDDGSTDGSGAVADALAAAHRSVTALHRPNGGPAAARNTGLAACTGRWITFLDSDDLMTPDRISRQSSIHATLDPSAVLVGAQEFVIADGVVPPSSVRAALDRSGPSPYTMSMFLELETLRVAGGFDESFRVGEDMELLMRLQRTGSPIVRVDDIWTIRRVFGDNLVYDEPAVDEAKVAAIRRNRPSRGGRVADDADAATVSVVIPARDAAAHLGECIESVLRQSHAVHEVIVVDDGSTDDTVAIAAAFGRPVRVVRQAALGANPARNRGVRESTGAFLAFIDADDLWEPDKLRRQFEVFATNPGVDLVFGMVTQFRSPEIPEHLVVLPLDADEPMVGHHVGTLLVRRDTFDAIGWFDESNDFGDFVDWFARATDQERRIDVVDEVVMRRRLHLHNKGRSARAGPDQYAKVLRRVVERRKLADD